MSVRRTLLSILILALLLAACDAGPTAPPLIISDTPPTRRPTLTPWPTVTPAATLTPIPTATGEPRVVPTPIDETNRDYELCVGIASDSNGYGHVSFQLPDEEMGNPEVISYIQPISVPLAAHLEAEGLDYLEVVDKSLSAAGLTTATSNYLESGQFAELRMSRCKFVVVTPFIPDVAVNLIEPEVYVTNLEQLVRDLARATPESRILVLNYYGTDRAEFTIDNSGRGMTAGRLAEFNTAIAKACEPGGVLGAYEQVVCLDTPHLLEGMTEPVVISEVSLEEYEASLYRTNVYSATIDEFFQRNPDGIIIGDGIHLSQAGRDKLARQLARIIFEMTGAF